jgi:hypothetical protein
MQSKWLTGVLLVAVVGAAVVAAAQKPVQAPAAAKAPVVLQTILG